MPIRLLVLGGGSFVGRALVADGLARRWEVTTFTRGRTPGIDDPRVARRIGDRTDPATLAPLGDREWVDYAAAKRGAELAIATGFGERALLARCGLILGPHEDVGRLPWWLTRLARGGEVLAPGPPSLPLQYIDARDLAHFALGAALAGHGGPVNVVSRRGHATMGSLLKTAARVAAAPGTRLWWTEPAALAQAGVEPWTELPIWIPPGHQYEGMHGADVERAHALGLRCRPVADTVADTWAWMAGLPGATPRRPDLPAPGIDPERERAVLQAAHQL